VAEAQIPPEGGQRGGWLPFALMALIVAGVGFSVALLLGGDQEDGGGIKRARGERVAVVSIDGLIVDSEPIRKALRIVEKRDNVAAVVVRVDSPGGAVGPSQEIYQMLREYPKPVVVSMRAIAASGAFYLASAADRVLANAGTLTGSIGVIMQFLDLSDLLEWAKIGMNVIKTGPFKDTGASHRSMSVTEQTYMQSLADEVLAQFVADVAAGRAAAGVTDVAVAQYADGSIFTGQTALERGLIDEIGNFETAVSAAASLAGIEGEPKLFRPRVREQWWTRVLEEGLDAPVGWRGAAVPLWAVWTPAP